MVTWLEILCALDLEETSRATLEHAAEVARRFGARLTLLHVRELPRASGARVLASAPARADAEEAEAARVLERWRQEAERLAGGPVATLLAAGAPGAEIARAAREGPFDLVVVGTHGRAGLGRILGSTAEEVVRGAPCPVLVARAPPDRGD